MTLPRLSPGIVKMWVAGRVPPDVQGSLARLASAADVVRVAVMPDVHLAHDVCVGTVLATTRRIYPAAVGGDIGCGMIAASFDVDATALDDADRAGRMFDRLRRLVPVHRHPAPRPLPSSLTETPLSDARLQTIARRDGRVQLGTLGRGNHFLEFQSDDDGRLWVMIHSGSRAVGPAVRDLHVARAAAERTGLASLDAESDDDRAYLTDAAWASRYADVNRRAMLDAAAAVLADVLGAAIVPSSVIACDHNHVRREQHADGLLWVHRKGAISAAAGEAGIIPGSMGTRSFHVEGRGNAESLCSSSHGAGRTMSRDEARRRISAKELRRQLAGVWFDAAAEHALRDEAPGAYKDVRAVMRAQRDLTRIVRRLRPVLVYKGT
jgi:tRNA-splicing ligase RtcB (3'-phosphate/5'-hydroxy nucleic acid ligase)